MTAQQLGRWYELLLAQERSSLHALFAGEPRSCIASAIGDRVAAVRIYDDVSPPGEATS